MLSLTDDCGVDSFAHVLRTVKDFIIRALVAGGLPCNVTPLGFELKNKFQAHA